MIKKSFSRKLYLGTSGWVYEHWEGVFYPENLTGKDKLKYFSKYFKTTEINYSFYHLPSRETFQKWYQETPVDFIFSVKASRFITHTCLAGRRVKRLKDVEKPWKIFLENALNLKEKLGPILFQFPPNFKATEENLERMKKFLRFITKYKIQNTKYKIRFAFEFRHDSWCDKEIYNLLKKYNAAWVIADSPIYPYIETLKKFRSGRLARGENRPKAEVVTADFVYIRMHAPYINFQRLRRFCSENTGSCITGHGSKVLFSSKYTKKELQDLTQKIKKWLKNGLDVYCYFNNDAYGYAIENTKELLEILANRSKI